MIKKRGRKKKLPANQAGVDGKGSDVSEEQDSPVLDLEKSIIKKLIKKGAVSRSRFDRSQADFFKAQQQLIKSNTIIKTAESSLKEAIADQSDMFTSTVSATITDLYETKRNPLVARFSQITGNLIGGSGASGTYTYKLGVFETTPVESLLNIYFETSTTGLISSLNNAILTLSLIHI